MDMIELDQIKDISFSGMKETDVNSLRLYINRCKTSEEAEDIVIGERVIKDSFRVMLDDTLPTIQIEFETYIGYSIRNESYTVWDSEEVFEGKLFRIYSKSKYLDFIKASTIATEDYPGPFVHYELVCLDHIIDIVSVSKPIVKEVGE